MSYTVFARKYRPQTFDDVIGQEHITRTLKNAIEQRRLAHAYIFVGPRGTGKTSTARILAKGLNCQNFPGPTTTPCGTCDSCREIAGGNSLDVLEFDAASNTQVDKVRELIIDNVKYAPARGRYKVYIVDEVHMLSTSSFNALLKTLEEPPEHVKFAFATTDVQKVPTTILSRCQRFDLKRIPAPLIASHLQGIAKQEKITLSSAASETIAHGAEGGMRDAESMLDQLVAFCGETIEESDVLTVFGLTAHQTVVGLAEHLLGARTAGALAMVHEQSEAGRDLTRLMSDLITHLRNLLVAQADPGSLRGEQSDEGLRALVEQAGQVTKEKLLELIEQFAGAETRMRWSPNRQMHFEIAVIRAIQTLGQATLTEVLEALSAMRDGGAPPARTLPAARSDSPSATKSSRAAAPAAALKVGPSAMVAERSAAAPVSNEPAAVVREEPSEPKVTPSVAAKAPENAPVAEPASLIAEPAATKLKEPNFARDEPPAAAPAAPLQRDLLACWPEVIEQVRSLRPLIVPWVEAGTLLEVRGGVALLGFPTEQGLAAEYCQAAQNRTFLEELLSTFAGEPMELKTRLQPGLAVKTPSARPPQVAADPMEDFRNDPLIRRALEIFRAQIQPA